MTLALVAWGVAPVVTGTSARHPQALALVAQNPAALVDPFVGTGSGGQTEGMINSFPGASMPFGMIQWSPDTTSRPPGGGYYYGDSRITGFSLTHVSGPGCAIGGVIPVLPVAGTLPARLSDASETFSHSSETAHPGYYAVTAGGVRTQLAVTDRTGVAQFTYPAHSQARLLVKVASSDSGSRATTFRTSGDREITGSVTTGGFCHQPDVYTVYFAARFSRPFTSTGTWRLKTGMPAGAWLDFGSTRDRGVGMQVAISYVSTQGTLRNLAAEAHTWSVKPVAARASSAWNRQLGTIFVGGGSRVARAEFYTALYHASLEPSLFSDANGEYPGFDGEIHSVQPGHAQYTNFAGWDIYRCEVPLLATINPRVAADMATSLLNDAAQGGALPRWPVANGYTGIMNGDSADPILADIYAFGARGFDAKAALSYMIHGANETTGTGQGWYVERPNAAAYIAHGYVPNVKPDSGSAIPNGASETLEYAIDDFSISRLAQDLGDSADARTFAIRSQNWANLFDTAHGYIEPRDASGAFPSGPPLQGADPRRGQDGFEEGNAAQYTWMVPHNLAGLIQGMGGGRAAVARLDRFFTRLNAGVAQPYAWQGNEVGLGTPWIYNSAGEPWKTQALVKRITSQLYSLTPGGEPGNDDLGALSSWYVWATLGLYQQTPGVPMLVLGTPQFPREVIHGAYGQLTINASGAGDTYVRGLTVNGKPSSHTYITLKGTSELDFTLSKSPDTSWGSAAGDAPPSFGAGPVHFPGTSAP
jgi:predicted alpha-1,2-mannosidase